MAAEVAPRDGVDLRLRVGLNSGRGDRRRNRVGRIGLHRDGRTSGNGPADGDGGAARRGDAQRIDRTAGRGPGRAGRARDRAHQGCSVDPVPARRLLAIVKRPAELGACSRRFIGRRNWEMERSRRASSTESTQRATGVSSALLAPPGIGKSRIVPRTRLAREPL